MTAVEMQNSSSAVSESPQNILPTAELCKDLSPMEQSNPSRVETAGFCFHQIFDSLHKMALSSCHTWRNLRGTTGARIEDLEP